jgi:drug/metabolite transporter (DMT)-like permease
MSANLSSFGRVVDLGLLGAAIIAVAVADVLLKKAAAAGNFEQALKSPFLWGAVLLYLFQIVFFVYAFVAGWKLSSVGIMQTVLYVLIVLGAGVLLYRETLTPMQMAGAALAIGGIVLLNLR